MKIAIVGASGMVGRTFLSILEEKGFSHRTLTLFASSRSAGISVKYQNHDLIIRELNEKSFDEGFDIALFSAGGSTSLKYAPIAESKGCIVIDNSSAFRMDPKVPLIVPEVNANEIKNMTGKIIANPNCSTIQSVLILNALKELNIKRVAYTTYQAVSGSGYQGIMDLERTLNNESPSYYPKPIAHNVIPLIDVLLENGYSKEEVKMMEETKKILNLPNLKVSATCVRVPVRNAHSVSIQCEFEKEFDIEYVKELLNAHPFVKVSEEIITPRDVSGHDIAMVTRLRRDLSVDYGLHCFVVADNIRKGAALNAIQILELLFERSN